MGRVVLAKDLRLDRKVAIKLLHGSLGSEFRERFGLEARAVANLQHPSIVSVYDVGEDGDLAYIVFEYIEGANLEELIGKGNISIKKALQIALDISYALLYAHSIGVVHRDIKPANILIDKRNGRAKLTDFGIARHLSERRITRAGFFGTPNFIAPELIRGGVQSYDRRSDIYSLGATFYELFTGKLPYDSPESSDYEILFRKASGEKPISPDSVRRGLPNKLSELINDMLENDIEKRTASMSDIVSSLEEILRELPGDEILYAASSMKATITEDIDELDKVAPSKFFGSKGFPGTAFFQDETVRFNKIQESLIFYRDHLNDEYRNLLRQARLTYYLWLFCVGIGFVLLLSSVVAMLMGRIQEGIASSAITLVVFFIQRLFQQREDHYRALARAKNDHLEYGNQWLLVIQSIDGIADDKKRAAEQAKLVEVLLHKLRHRSMRTRDPSGEIASEK